MVDKNDRINSLKITFLSLFLMKSRRKDMEQRIRDKKLGITFPNLKILYFLQSGPNTISYLSRQMMIAPPTIVPMIDSLEAKGLVIKKSDPGDRRRNIITLTGKGTATISKAPLISDEDSILKAVAKLGSEKSMQLIDLMQELTERIAEVDPDTLKYDMEKRMKSQMMKLVK